jgi:hypothetical protein
MQSMLATQNQYLSGAASDNFMYSGYREQIPREEGVVNLPKREHDHWANLTGGAYSAQSITSSFLNIFVTQTRPTLTF